MAYNTPELLLVGAAQNLVLEGSLDGSNNKIEDLCKPGPLDEDPSDSYSTLPTW